MRDDTRHQAPSRNVCLNGVGVARAWARLLVVLVAFVLSLGFVAGVSVSAASTTGVYYDANDDVSIDPNPFGGLALGIENVELAPDAAAEVIGRPITVTALDHWMLVAAKASAGPGSVVVVPLQPPGFASCLAQVRKKLHRLARDSDAKIKLYCHRLFRSLNSDVLDFLIMAHWYEAAAAHRGIAFSGRQITVKFDEEKRQQFATGGAFRAFLRQTGQTVADVRFRVRLNLIYDALIKREGGKTDTVEAQARRAYQADTECAPYYVMDDCASAK